jgi:cytochrome c-type biogenesis protein
MESSIGLSIVTAFFAGLISFLSPCVLPLVPGYLSIISGFSLDQLKDNADASLKRSVIFSSIMFIIGFSITFIAEGATATALGKAILTRMPILLRIAGLVIIVFGLHQLGVFRLNFLYQDKRALHHVQTPRGAIGALLLGLVFALGWSPCIGPILGGILALASQQETVWQGVFLLAVYSLGLGVPFLLTSLGLNQFLSFYGRFKKHFDTLEKVSGVLVLVIGLMIVTGSMTMMNRYFQFLNNFEYRIEQGFQHLVGG